MATNCLIDGWLPVDACLSIHGVNYNTEFGNLQVFSYAVESG